MLVRDSNFFQKAESKSRILGGLHPNRTRGRKARREGGGNQDNLETNSLLEACLNTTDTPSECYVVPRRDLGGEKVRLTEFGKSYSN